MPRRDGKRGGGGRGGGGRGGKGAAAPSCTAVNMTSLSAQRAALPAYFLRHWPARSVSFEMAQRTYQGLAGWGRTRFQIVGGALYYPNLAHNTFGCVLRRTPILAWALLEMLDRHPNTPDVDVPVNCRDKPGSLRGARRPPELAFSYTTGRAFSDVPLPDYTYWGLPYADLPPWREWLALSAAPENAWERKLDSMIWVGSPTNPLRQAFKTCAAKRFGARLMHRMPRKEPMHELAWRCKPNASGVPCATKPPDWTPLQEQCRYRYILHLPGISDWLEHFKHQLACGSVNIFLGPRPPRAWLRRGASARLRPPTVFEHFDFSGPLLTEGVHFIHVPTTGEGAGKSVCSQLDAVLRALEARPERARCVASAGQALARSLDLDSVYSYMAGELRTTAGPARLALDPPRGLRDAHAQPPHPPQTRCAARPSGSSPTWRGASCRPSARGASPSATSSPSSRPRSGRGWSTSSCPRTAPPSTPRRCCRRTAQSPPLASSTDLFF